MKKSRYTEEQVAYALRLAQSGTPVADVCPQAGIAEATFYLWKKKFGSLGVPEVCELRQMREENAWLKRLVADLTLDKQILQEVIRSGVAIRLVSIFKPSCSWMAVIRLPWLLSRSVQSSDHSRSISKSPGIPVPSITRPPA